MFSPVPFPDQLGANDRRAGISDLRSAHGFAFNLIGQQIKRTLGGAVWPAIGQFLNAVVSVLIKPYFSPIPDPLGSAC